MSSLYAEKEDAGYGVWRLDEVIGCAQMKKQAT